MKIARLLLLCSLALQMGYTQTWTTLNIPVVGRYDDLFFLNDTVGWACNKEGQAHKTIDGGATWTGYTVNHLNYLRCIEFMDADTGFCGAFRNDQFLYKSTDGGLTWQDITARVPGLTSGICGLSCPGGQLIYGCGIWASPAFFVKSADGGLSWQKTDMSAYASALVDILFINRDTGWVSGRAPQNAGGIILHTTDGGATWQTVYDTHIHGDYVWKLQRLEQQRWFASIERDPAAGATTNILKSVDDGLSWETLLVSNDYFRLQAVGFITPQHGWAGDAQLFETIDGGQSWNNINGNTIFGGAFNRFFRINGEKAMLSGKQVYRFDAATSQAYEPGSKDNNTEIHTLTVSPNPTTGDIQIAITLKQQTQVILKIYAFNGGFEEVLWTGEQDQGDYLLQTSLAQKPPGMYVVYLKTHHGTQHVLVTLASNK